MFVARLVDVERQLFALGRAEHALFEAHRARLHGGDEIEHHERFRARVLGEAPASPLLGAEAGVEHRRQVRVHLAGVEERQREDRRGAEAHDARRSCRGSSGPATGSRARARRWRASVRLQLPRRSFPQELVRRARRPSAPPARGTRSHREVEAGRSSGCQTVSRRFTAAGRHTCDARQANGCRGLGKPRCQPRTPWMRQRFLRMSWRNRMPVS